MLGNGAVFVIPDPDPESKGFFWRSVSTVAKRSTVSTVAQRSSGCSGRAGGFTMRLMISLMIRLMIRGSVGATFRSR